MDKRRKKPKTFAENLPGIFDSDDSSSGSRSDTKIGRKKRTRPKTITDKVAFLITDDKDSADSDSDGQQIKRKRKKPSTITGTIAFLFNTDKATVRKAVTIIILVTSVIGFLAIVNARSKIEVNYWKSQQSTSDFISNILEDKAMERYNRMPSARRKIVRQELKQTFLNGEDAREIYENLSDSEKSEIREEFSE